MTMVLCNVLSIMNADSLLSNWTEEEIIRLSGVPIEDDAEEHDDIESFDDATEQHDDNDEWKQMLCTVKKAIERAVVYYEDAKRQYQCAKESVAVAKKEFADVEEQENVIALFQKMQGCKAKEGEARKIMENAWKRLKQRKLALREIYDETLTNQVGTRPDMYPTDYYSKSNF